MVAREDFCRGLLMKTVFAGFATMGLIFGGNALAADLPVKGPWPAPPMYLFTWTACYLGGSAGGGWGHKESADPTAIITGAASIPLVTVNPSGWLVGAQAGCDYQFSGNVVIGAEATFSGGLIEGHSVLPILHGNPGDSATATAKIDALATATGRLGYAFDRSLLYAKGGFAWADEHFSAIGVFTGTSFDLEAPSTRFGWTVGAGLEWAFSDYWSVRLEYDFYGFGDHGVTFRDTFSGTSGPIAIKQTLQVVKLGLSFRFMASPPAAAPVVTKY